MRRSRIRRSHCLRRMYSTQVSQRWRSCSWRQAARVARSAKRMRSVHSTHRRKGGRVWARNKTFFSDVANSRMPLILYTLSRQRTNNVRSKARVPSERCCGLRQASHLPKAQASSRLVWLRTAHASGCQ